MNDVFIVLSVIILIFAPLIILPFLYGLKVSFDLELEAKPGIFLRHLNSPQRAYLRQQRRLIAGYFLCSWLSLVVFIIGLSGGRQELNSHWNLGWCAFLAFMFAQFSVDQKGPELRFVRTRPLTLCFLFWGRTGMALTSLLTAIATAAMGLFLMLWMSYGSVWSQGTGVTFPLQAFLPLLTTTALVFGLVVAVGNLSWRFITNSSLKSGLLYGSLMWCLFSALIQRARFARFLVQYNNAGPPASYAYALVLLAIAAALLRLAQFFNGRRETS